MKLRQWILHKKIRALINDIHACATRYYTFLLCHVCRYAFTIIANILVFGSFWGLLEHVNKGDVDANDLNPSDKKIFWVCQCKSWLNNYHCEKHVEVIPFQTAHPLWWHLSNSPIIHVCFSLSTAADNGSGCISYWDSSDIALSVSSPWESWCGMS